MSPRLTSSIALAAAIAGVSAGAVVFAQQQRTPLAPVRPAVSGAPKTAVNAPANDSAAITGLVLDGAGKPASRALVMIAATDRGLIRTVAADARGRFTLDHLSAGHYLLAAGKATFIAAMYGAGRVSGPGAAIALEPREQKHDVTIALTPGAVIAGHVFDAEGQPLANVRVRASQRRELAGEVTLQGDFGDPVGAVTDDRGVYRIFDLEAGVYTIAAQPRGNPGSVRGSSTPDTARPLAYQPVYFPNATSAAASTPIVLSPGEIRDDIDLRTTLAPLSRVSGVVLRNGAPDATGLAQITLRPVGSSAGAIFNVFNTRTGSDGRFVLPNVTPGDYRLLARLLPPASSNRPVQPASQLYAVAEVSVRDRDVNDAALSLVPGATLSGHVVFQGLPGLPDDIGSVRVSVRPTPASAVPFIPDVVTTDARANFTIAGLAPGKYRLFVQVPNNNVTQAPEWYEKTAALKGADAFDVPFEVSPGESLANVTVLLTDDEQEIDGHVRDAGAKAIAGASVVVFPADKQFWFQGSRRIVVRQTDAQGAFVFGLSAALPTGDYLVAAVPPLALAPNDQFDPAVLEALSKSAARVTLDVNDTKTADLVIKPR